LEKSYDRWCTTNNTWGFPQPSARASWYYGNELIIIVVVLGIQDVLTVGRRSIFYIIATRKTIKKNQVLLLSWSSDERVEYLSTRMGNIWICYWNFPEVSHVTIKHFLCVTQVSLDRIRVSTSKDYILLYLCTSGVREHAHTLSGTIVFKIGKKKKRFSVKLDPYNRIRLSFIRNGL